MPLDKSFGIREGYSHRLDNAFHDDTAYKDEWQREVYEIALKAATVTDATSVADVGCGSGFKLLKYFSHLHTIGFDLEPTLSFLRQTYPDRDWRESSFAAEVGPVDVVVCSDVVEHLPDPDQLMEFLSRIPFKVLILSTPERQLVYGHDQSGPPANPAHCREWTLPEFKAYASHWFDIVDGGITNQEQATQALVCTPKPNPRGRAEATPKPAILAVFLEFTLWELARKWSYASSYALLDGLRACGCDVVVLPSLKTAEPRDNPWVAVREAVLQGRTFDQVWIWVTHSHYEADLWPWLESIAPVRVGVLMESLTYDPADVAEQPLLAQRKAHVYDQLRSLTHVMTADSTEAAMIETETGHPTRAYLPMLPRALLSEASAPTHPVAIFLGTVYGKRLAFLNQNAADSALRMVTPPEQGTSIPAMFDTITAEALAGLRDTGASAALAAAYVEAIRQLRLDVVRQTLATYNACLAGVALPAMFKGVTGRVVEMIAASTPVLMPRLACPDPGSALVDGENVLCYDPAVPEDLERQIRRLVDEPGLRERIVAQARTTFATELCSEVQIEGLLRWLVDTTP